MYISNIYIYRYIIILYSRYLITYILYKSIFDIHIDCHDTIHLLPFQSFPYTVHDDPMLPLDVMVHATKTGPKKESKTAWQQKGSTKKEKLSCIHWYCICNILL